MSDSLEYPFLYSEFCNIVNETKGYEYSLREFMTKLNTESDEFHFDFVDRRKYIDHYIIRDFCKNKNNRNAFRICSFPKKDKSDGAIYLILFENGKWEWYSLLKNVDFIKHTNYLPTLAKIKAEPELVKTLKLPDRTMIL